MKIRLAEAIDMAVLSGKKRTDVIREIKSSLWPNDEPLKKDRKWSELQKVTKYKRDDLNKIAKALSVDVNFLTGFEQ